VTLHVWRSERADGLLGPLADLLTDLPPDPFTPEVVAVPTAGIERWVAQELSLRLGTAPDARDGICANVAFPFPGTLVIRALEAAAGLPEDGDPWTPDRLVWAVLARFADRPDPRLWGPASTHLAAEDDGRRYQAARHLADLFDRYAVHRPAMVRAWSSGDDVGPDLAPIGAGHAWQPPAWRALREALDVPSTAERLVPAAHRLAADEVDLDLPARLSVFGLSALPASYLEVLAAMAGPRDVHLFLRHPSPVLWERVAALHRDEPPRRGPRAADRTAELPLHPLLRSWGRDAREMQTVFAALGAPPAHHRSTPDDAEVAAADAATLLHRLQTDLRQDRRPTGAPAGRASDRRPRLDPADRSVQVHASHGRLRQVQVLRDAILHLLADLPDLEPRDIIVMCPDVEAFAPYVDAVFGAQAVSVTDAAEPEAVTSTRRDTPPLRVRIADRSLRQVNPVLKVLAELLDLADDRLTGPQVYDLLSRAPVRARFGFTDDDLARIEAWIPDLGIRWGLDAADRDRFDLGGVDANTWRFGMRRLLTGIAVADEDLRLIADTVPYDDVEGSDVELAGRLAECVTRLTGVVTALREPRSLRDWAALLTDAAQRLTLTAGPDAWQEVQLHRLVDALLDQAGAAADQVILSLADVRALLGDRLRGRPTRASHRTGDLTFSTLVPMRAVPHRVVCLLGMDDGSFPRRTVPDGDDLIDEVPFVGDRDPRTEDRQLLLDALLAATDHLVVTYSGRDERTNEPLPPAVPVGELLDVVDATVTTGQVDANGESVPARRRVVVDHPLQPFDARNYREDGLGTTGPWSFDRIGLSGAQAHAGELAEVAPFLAEPLPVREEDRQVVDLGQLVRFLEQPVRFFLGERLGVWLRTDRDAVQDGIPLDLAGLPKWAIGDRMLTALRQGHTRANWERAERARGTLPPDPLAARILEEVCPIVEALVQAADQHLGTTPAQAHDVDLVLPDGRRLIGTVGAVHGETLGLVTYSKLGAKHRLAAYARLVALTAAAPATAWRAVLLGRTTRRELVEVCQLGPLGEDPAARQAEASSRLATLLDLYDRGLRAPAPMYGNTSQAIARGIAAGKGPWRAAKEWETTNSGFPNDDLDACHVAVLGGVVTFDDLMTPPPAPDEGEPEWPACQERVVAWARRLWDPVLAIESEGGR
jgi:exodeoxyribonuclease V gamma subunit